LLKLTQAITNNKTWGTVSCVAGAGQFFERSIQSIICRSGSIIQAPKENEFITSEQLENCDEILLNLIKNLF